MSHYKKPLPANLTKVKTKDTATFSSFSSAADSFFPASPSGDRSFFPSSPTGEKGFFPTSTSKKSPKVDELALFSVRDLLSADESLNSHVIYPALISNVARSFRSRIPLATFTKNSLEYQNCFQGKDAVDVLAYVINTADRNLALLLGRCLDAQNFFHDVVYEHRLRDSQNELYKFEDSIETALLIEDAFDENLPTSVFVLLTDCYSPTCTRDYLCYSITCPRRLEQGAQLWSTSVPPSVLESVTKMERLRQETIFELIQGEREFVDDLDTTMRVFIRPLRESTVLDPYRRESFIKEVFSNISDLHAINAKLLRKLLARQKEKQVVDKIGDIFVNIADEFFPFIEYGARQVFAKVALDEEKAVNPKLVQFLKECEKLPELRKLPLESFLARPTTRMGRYPLLLKPVMEKASESHPDRTLIPQAIITIREILSSINAEAGKAENTVKLSKLQKHLVFADGEQEDMKLTEEGRIIVREGRLTYRRANAESEVFAILLDHSLLITRKKENGFLKVVRKPIPLELIVIADKATPVRPVSDAATPKGLVSKATVKPVNGPPIVDVGKMYSINIVHLGNSGGIFQLVASSVAEQHAWTDSIEKHRMLLLEKKKRFQVVTLINNVFPNTNRVHCSATFSNRLILGTDQGVFVGPDSTFKLAEPITTVFPNSTGISGDNHYPDSQGHGSYTRVLDLEKVLQVDVLANYDMLLVLADKTLLAFPLQVLDVNEAEAGLWARRGKKIGTHVSFFKQGLCADRTLVCAVKSTSLTATIKVLEPVGLGTSNLRGKIGKLFRATNDSLRVFKEFYIPTESSSIHFLRTKLCVGCAKGFEIVDLDTLNTQGLLDPTDETLDFVLKKELVRPISIFRIREQFGFYVDKLGKRSRKDWLVTWSGTPTSFAYMAPYIIAFDPSFIEIRHVDTGELQQIIPTQNLSLLNVHPDSLHCVMDGTLEYQHIFKLQRLEYVGQ